MNNYVSSVIRTWVPIAIGTAVAWLSANAGFVLDESSQVGLTAAATGSAIGIYYAVVRRLEVTFPQIGWLLGLAKTPAYDDGSVVARNLTFDQPSPGPLPDEGDA